MSRINQVIAGRYRLKELIGQGGMADVYLAHDEILNRIAAVKLLRSSLTGDPVYITRFHREASAASALNHKNIVQIYDVGEEDDNYYIVMEYVPGQTLKELIYKRGALHYVEAIDIMKQVVSAVAKAHSMGIVHRDLKPQNILVTDSGVVKIADFGIASIQSLSQVTQTDTIMGSLHYLAPEIARGEKATIQSDIYALGIVFYELLRGEVPFNGESPVNIALKHMRDEIPSLRAFNPSIPQSVENIIIKATAKNIKDRYSFCKEMYDDLLVCLNKDKENEEKLEFKYQGEEEPTIIADDNKFFTKQVNEEIDEDIQEEEKEDVKKKFKFKKQYAYIGGGILFVLLVIGFIYFFFFSVGDNFPMPNLIGLPEDDALMVLEEKKLEVDKTKIKRELSDQYEEGYVIETDPIENSSVKEGDEVILTVSSGKYIIVDNYVGQNYDDVKKTLEEMGFTVTSEKVSSEESIGTILTQSLVANQQYDPHTTDKTIHFTISKGIEITVPNVYGMSIDQAKKLLEGSDYGFIVKLKVLTPPTSASEIETMKLNVVMKQSIDAFTKLTKKKGREITLSYYNKRPEIPQEPDEPEPEPDSPTMPTEPDED